MIPNHQVILGPIVTEKSNQLREKHKYTFVVHLQANKLQILSVLKKEYNITPVSCNIIRNKPKPRKTRMTRGYTNQWKKAIVTLNKGDTIPLFEGT